METVKLYYENAFLQDFTAVVESCGAVKGGFAVVLDRTAFYPEGGGQPADHGSSWSHRWVTTPSFSCTSSTRASPSVPWSAGCPPPSG